MTQVIQFPIARCKTGKVSSTAGEVFEFPLCQGMSSKEAEFVRRAAAILAHATCVPSGEKVDKAQAFAHARKLVDQVRRAR